LAQVLVHPQAKTAFDFFGSEFPDEYFRLLLMSRANTIGARAIRKISARREHFRNRQAPPSTS
jgi:hypothetical protein